MSPAEAQEVRNVLLHNDPTYRELAERQPPVRRQAPPVHRPALPHRFRNIEEVTLKN